MSVVPSSPVVLIEVGITEVRVDGEVVRHDGSRPLQEVGVRAAADRVARVLGRPVRARAVDARGQVALVIHPDGTTSNLTRLADEVAPPPVVEPDPDDTIDSAALAALREVMPPPPPGDPAAGDPVPPAARLGVPADDEPPSVAAVAAFTAVASPPVADRAADADAFAALRATRQRATPPVSRDPRWSGALVGGAAASVVVLLLATIGLVVLLGRQGGDPAPVAAPARADASPSTTPGSSPDATPTARAATPSGQPTPTAPVQRIRVRAVADTAQVRLRITAPVHPAQAVVLLTPEGATKPAVRRVVVLSRRTTVVTVDGVSSGATTWTVRVAGARAATGEVHVSAPPPAPTAPAAGSGSTGSSPSGGGSGSSGGRTPSGPKGVNDGGGPSGPKGP